MYLQFYKYGQMSSLIGQRTLPICPHGKNKIQPGTKSVQIQPFPKRELLVLSTCTCADSKTETELTGRISPLPAACSNM
jgi:hypothetical protein